MLAVLVGAALMGPGAWFALKKYEARLTDRIRSDVESKMLSPPERPPRATPRRACGRACRRAPPEGVRRRAAGVVRIGPRFFVRGFDVFP